MSSKAFFERADRAGGYEAEQRSRQANRRRLLVFVSVFVVLSLVGLVYDYSRPAIYRSSARLNFVPVAPPSGPDAPDVKPYALRDEVQYLTSRPLLATVWADLKDAAATPAILQSVDAPAVLQTMLTATQVPGTNVVLLEARGREPAFLSLFVDRLVTAYRTGLDQRYRSGSATALAEADGESRKLDASVADKRREVDAFRTRNNIVSTDRDDNQVLSGVKGVGTALNTANEKLVAAQAKLATLQGAGAGGPSAVRAKDDPVLAALEQQAIGIRADLRETARTFTPEYMQIDPRVRALRARLAELEEQMTVQRQAGRQGALQDATDELNTARAAVAALRQQLAADQASVQSFTSRFNQYKGLQEELTHLEQLRQKAADRVAVLDAGERVRMPKVDVVEAASTPQAPESPLYARDAGLVLAAALLVALATMGVVELFNRPPRQPATIVVPQAWVPQAAIDQAMALPQAANVAALPDESARSMPTPALPAPQRLPRELTTSELDLLIDATQREVRAAAALLLTGLTASEIVGLRRGDVDRAAATVTIAGVDERVVALPPNGIDWLPRDEEPADAALLAVGKRPMNEADIETGLLYAAHDAGIAEADEVTPQALRHTCIAFLVRQGLRFGDLARIVGPLPADRLAAYKRLAPDGPSIAAVERVLPVLRR
ncbi:MAG: tyrosine-type recombinase/integrase [Burkholderiaceae bacterium]